MGWLLFSLCEIKGSSKFKEHLFQGKPFSGYRCKIPKKILRKLNNNRCFKSIRNPMLETWFCERLFFEMIGNSLSKRLKKYKMKDTK